MHHAVWREEVWREEVSAQFTELSQDAAITCSPYQCSWQALFLAVSPHVIGSPAISVLKPQDAPLGPLSPVESDNLVMGMSL